MRFIAFLSFTPLESAAQEHFPAGTLQHVGLSASESEKNIIALRVSFAGELGWELHIPAENSLEIYDALFEAAEGVNVDLKDAWAALSRGAFSRFHGSYNASHGYIIHVLIIVVRSFIFHTTIMSSYIFK